MAIDLYKTHLCMWSVSICLNQEMIENSLIPDLLRRTLKNYFIWQREIILFEDLIQYIQSSLHTKHNLQFLLLLLRKGSSLCVQCVLWWTIVQGQSRLQQLLLSSFILPLPCPRLWGCKGGRAVQWTAAGNCSGWKLTWQKDFLFCFVCFAALFFCQIPEP